MTDINKFSVDIINDIPQDEDMDFSICRIQALSDGYNTHGLTIPEEVLKRDAETCIGKFIVAKIKKDIFGSKDFEGHELDEVIIGYIPTDAEIRFVENDSDNGVFFEVDAVLSKLYADATIDIFRRDGAKSVSCEFTCTFSDEEKTTIDSFNIHGITILGSDINPSCVGANAEIIQFSEKAEEFYNSQIESRCFSEDKKFTEVLDKLNKIYEKLENKGDNVIMVDKQQFAAVNIGDLWGKIYVMLDEKEKWGYCIEGVYEESNQKFAILRNRNEEFFRLNFSLTEDGGLEFSEEIIAVEKQFIEKGDFVKFEEPENAEQYKTFTEPKEGEGEPKDEDEKSEGEKEKMAEDEKMGCGEKLEEEKLSSDAYVDPAAQLEVSDEQAEKNEELAKQLEEKEDIIMKYEAELDELRKFKDETLESRKMSEVNSLLAKLQGRIDSEKYEAIKTKGEEIKFEEFSAWKNSVLASFAEDVLEFSESNETNIRMSIPDEKKEVKSIWDRI